VKKLFCGAIVLALCVLFSPSTFGQAQFTTGSVQGDVLDEKGGSVPDATVEAKNLDTNFVRTEATNSDGHFQFLNLAPGRYTLTISKAGFSTIIQENIHLTVGQNLSIPVTVKVSSVATQIVVSDVPVIELTKTESSSTLDESAIATTPVLGRKFEDLLTLTPGVSISQGPDGDEININGQRGIFNNISLDGGDYNNGFFGEQMGGQRAAVDITLDAVKEFQVVASGANAEYGRTAGGVVNVITKSGTNNLHGSLFEYQRLKALSSSTSDGEPLEGFHREQFGGSIGGPIKKDKLFFFGSAEGIREDLTRKNLSTPIGTPCAVTPIFDGTLATDAIISSSPDCQRVALLNFLQTNFNEDDGKPVDHSIRNAAVFGRVDYNLNANNQIFGSYSFDWSKNPNQTFDVPTYGSTANGIEGPSKIQVFNTSWFSTLANNKVNEAHFTYSRENRPRNTIDPSSIPDTAMGFGTTFRFGQPFFLNPNVDELLWRTQIRDNFTVVHGKHTVKVGGEWLHTKNTQIFRGFFGGRYIFDSPVGFMRYASPDAPGGFGPSVGECLTGAGAFTGWITQDQGQTCAPGSSVGGPLLLFLQHGPATQGETFDQSGFSSIVNNEFALFAQDTWKIARNLTVNYGLRWEAQHFPDPVIPPSQTAYSPNLSDPNFPSDGTIHNQNKMFQPRVGFAWDIFGNGRSALRANAGIFNARQNMLTQVGAITTNGIQQQSFAAGSAFGTPPVFGTNAAPIENPPPAGTIPVGVDVTVFSKDYANPRIYSMNVGYEQQIVGDYAAYADFTWSKGVHLTRFINPNVGVDPNFDCSTIGGTNVNPGVCVPNNGDTVTYPSAVFGSGVATPFPNLGAITDTVSSAKSLYRGFTIGARKRMSHHFLFDANYTYSKDYDDDSNERDPFTFRYANLFNLASEYSYSDRDERHRFNFYTVANLPWGFDGNVRMQAHSAQPITAEPRFQNGIDTGRNSLRKDNAYFTFDFGVSRPFHVGERLSIIPKAEVFNLFNNKNNVNSLSTPALFDFNGFLRLGVGDPRQAQLSIRFEF
jgi:Carboxypeptidase regulatory-like domain/TonB-dependent Receptor Plug Domain